ncbi:MAG: hypothetical protein ACRDYU_09945 [Actinomycetes bacterium]
MSSDIGSHALTEDDLLATPTRALAALFARHPTSVLPDGRAQGTVLVGTGTPVARTLAGLTRAVAWKGKVVDRERGMLHNLLGPTGARAVPAAVATGPSLFDGRDCVALDYSRTSLLARMVRDEIREVSPGLWLGVAYVRSRRVAWFSLRFAHPTPPPQG